VGCTSGVLLLFWYYDGHTDPGTAARACRDDGLLHTSDVALVSRRSIVVAFTIWRSRLAARDRRVHTAPEVARLHRLRTGRHAGARNTLQSELQNVMRTMKCSLWIHRARPTPIRGATRHHL
jgi:hypothetical protein